MTSSRPAPRRLQIVVVSLVVVAVSLVGCSSSAGTAGLDQKLEKVAGLTSFQAKCVSAALSHSLTAKQLKTVAAADGRGGLTNATLSQKVQTAVNDCVVVPPTTLPAIAPGSSSGTPPSTTATTLEP